MIFGDKISLLLTLKIEQYVVKSCGTARLPVREQPGGSRRVAGSRGSRRSWRPRRRGGAGASPAVAGWLGLGVRVSKIGKISKILQIFGGLVLGCIKTNFCKKICVWQHFSRSTRFASFCTAAISKFSQKIGLKNQQFSWKFSEIQIFANVANFAKFCQISKNSAW